MPTCASWSGTDGVEQTLWYGEALYMVSERSLLFWTLKIMLDQVLRPHVVPFFAQHPGYLFQQDNAWAHTQNFLQANGIHVLDWQALFPDLAPIQHLWDELGRCIYNRQRQPKKVNKLQAALDQECNNTPQAFSNRLVNSIRHHCTAVVKADRGHTRY